MPIDYSKYPENWKTEIRPVVMSRAGEIRDSKGNVIQEAKCEECAAENKAVYILSGEKREYLPRIENSNFYRCPDGLGRLPGRSGGWVLKQIVLTVAHLDHDPGNEEVQLSRLKALCQKCHLQYDRAMHAENSRKTRIQRKGLTDMFEDAPGS